MSDILMPRLSDSMEEGTIVKWIASEGDEISEGDELVEIETDKANMVYEADESGTLTEIVAQEGDTVALGEPIARFGEGGGGDSSGSGEESEDDSADEDGDENVEADAGDDAEAEDDDSGDEEPEPDDAEDEDDESEGGAEEAAPEAKEAEQQPEDEESERGGSEEGGDPSDGGSDDADSSGSSGDDAAPRVKASPLARRIASESGVDLQNVKGSGPGGRILRADVEAAASGGSSVEAEAPAEKPKSDKKAKKSKKDKKAKKAEDSKDGAKAAPERGETAKGTTETVELTRLQQTVARRMSESKATAPHFYLQTDIDMSRAVEARAVLKASAREGDPVPSFNDMVVKACAVALAEYPRANGAYKDGRFELYSRINVGIAVAGQDALVVPTIFDCDKKGLREIATDARALAGKVRDRSITPPELSGATFTVSNLGMYGVTNFHAVINSPQAAILAVGAITEKPVIRDGELETAHLMGVTLACDHRILYGADGAEFLARVRALLEEPVGLAL